MEEIKISDLSKLDKQSLMDVDKFIKSKIKKSQKLRAVINKAFEDRGEDSKGDPACYDDIWNEIFYGKKFTAGDKTCCYAILCEMKEKVIKEPEDDEK